MRKILSVLVFVIFAVLSNSCTGTPGAPGTPGTAVMTFQNGVSPYSAWQGITDTSIRSGSPAYNHGSCDAIEIGYYDGAGLYISRVLMKVDLSAIVPDNVTVTNAFLSINAASFAGAATITAYAVTTNWSPGTGPCSNTITNDASWNNSATGLTWANAGGDFSNAKASDTLVVGMSNPGFYTFTLDPAVVQNWITNPSQNFGIILKGMDETGPFSTVEFSSSDGNLTYGPKFTVYYTVP